MNLWEQAERLSKSRFIPKDFAGKPEDIYFVLDFTEKVGDGELPILQALNGIYFKETGPCMKAHLLLSLVNNPCISPFEGGVKWSTKKTKEDMIVTAYSKVDDKEVSETIKLSDALRAYWKNTTWKTHPEYMLKIRSATLLCRTWASRLLSGLSSEDELLDIFGSTKKETSESNSPDYQLVKQTLNK